ncbi:MAG: hypothetical protein Q7R49_00010 [Candidatus Daviesbacteria bacterium]|nr:hypothetical protein [Candidatus Daviesbacteria bacterium]
MLKISVKGRVLLSIKDLVFIITWLFMLICIADAMNGQPRGMTIFLTIWWIFGFIYAWKIVDNYNLQKNKEPVAKNPTKKFFEA